MRWDELAHHLRSGPAIRTENSQQRSMDRPVRGKKGKKGRKVVDDRPRAKERQVAIAVPQESRREVKRLGARWWWLPASQQGRSGERQAGGDGICRANFSTTSGVEPGAAARKIFVSTSRRRPPPSFRVIGLNPDLILERHSSLGCSHFTLSGWRDNSIFTHGRLFT